MLQIPAYFFEIPYCGANYPASNHFDDFRKGANCQVFAYEILRYFGKQPPDLRSSNLWEDEEFYDHVQNLEALDLLLWNKTADAWGAHLGLYLGEGQVIHLAKAQGKAEIWPLERFSEQELYRFFIGAKRLR